MTNSRLLSRHVGPAYLVRAGMKKEEAVSWLCFTQDAGWVDCVNFSDPWSSLPLWPAARSQCCWDDGVSGLCRDHPSIPETSAAFKRNRLTTKLPATTSPHSHRAWRKQLLLDWLAWMLTVDLTHADSATFKINWMPINTRNIRKRCWEFYALRLCYAVMWDLTPVAVLTHGWEVPWYFHANIKVLYWRNFNELVHRCTVTSVTTSRADVKDEDENVNK